MPLKAEKLPSTPTIVPVTNVDASLKSHTNAPSNSLGSPIILKGVFYTIKSPRAV